jgi:uncharacterized protein (PEP-CTERM system associated)
MSCGRTGRHPPRGAGGGRDRRPYLSLPLMLFAVAAVERTTPAAAQLATGLSPSGTTGSSGAPTALPPPSGGFAPPSPSGLGTVPSSGAPTTLPPPPSGPFGLPNPLAPPNALPSVPLPAAAAPATPALGLPAPGAGITTLQLYDPNAPAVLIQPRVTIGERLTDNVFYSSTTRTAAAETSLIPGASISVDTPRFQGVLSGGAEGDIYAPSSELNQISANLFGQGTGTIVPGRLFVDLSSYITQASAIPGVGFVSPSSLPSTQQTQVYSNTISPYLRQSFDGLLDTELRYRFGATNFGGTTAITSTTVPETSNLSSGILNEGTFTATTGRDFARSLSRLTVDASSFDSNSTSQNTQFSAYDDIQYQIKPNISAVGRVGYQNLQYPDAPGATFAGATWLAGGRLGSAADYGYVSLQYGRVQGVYGLTGSANYQVTPTITVQAYLAQGISSPAQLFQTSLASSTLSPNGAIVDQDTGLPTAFYNPGTGLTNNVYRQHVYNVGANDHIGRNTYSIYTFYINQQTLTPPITAPTDSAGAAFTWTRDIRPDLNGSATAGYTRTTNVVTINSVAPVNNTSTITANIGVNYLFARQLTGSLIYSFSYQPNGGTITNGRVGDVVVNSLQLLLTKAF